MKQSVSVPLEVSEFEGKIPDIIQNLQKLLVEYGPDATLEFGTEAGYYESYSVSVCINRKETDEEEMLREQKQLQYKQMLHLREFAEYERLRKVFEK